ncbi:MAG TPA: hypothetical protein VES20_20960 [Bryobacteraceae bacterium]|nr:hypothetical protein [Bryobacteraceae bacterium]
MQAGDKKLPRQPVAVNVLSGSVPADLHQEVPCQVLYMGILHQARKSGQLWYYETPDGFKPFALQGRVRRVVEPQRGS